MFPIHPASIRIRLLILLSPLLVGLSGCTGGELPAPAPETNIVKTDDPPPPEPEPTPDPIDPFIPDPKPPVK